MYSDTVNGLVDRPPLELPEPVGAIVHLQEKLFVPVKEYPDVSASNTTAFCLIMAAAAVFLHSSVPPKHPVRHQLSPTNSRVVVTSEAACPLLLHQGERGFDGEPFITSDDGLMFWVPPGYPYIHTCVRHIESPAVCVGGVGWGVGWGVMTTVTVGHLSHGNLRALT